MLIKYEIELDIKEENKFNIYNWGSLLQGVIMENIEPEFAEQLHQTKYNIYSQYICFKEDKYIWTICTLTQEAYEQIIEKFILNTNEIEVRYKKIKVKILNKKEVSRDTFEELFKKWYMNSNPDQRIKLNLRTPVSYKVNNTYQIIPNIEYIMRNLINKWNAYNPSNTIDEDVLEEYIKRVYIERYNLRSVKYGIEGLNINSFMGILNLKINSNEIMTNLFNMLFIFAQYSGIGIKTSMGMGGIEIEKN